MPTVFAALIATGALPVPDAGPSGVLIGAAILSLGVAARLLKNRKR